MGFFPRLLLLLQLLLTPLLRFFVFAFEPLEFAFEAAFLFLLGLHLSRVSFSQSEFVFARSAAATPAARDHQPDHSDQRRSDNCFTPHRFEHANFSRMRLRRDHRDL